MSDNSSSDSEDDANLPDRDTCQKLTEQFAEVTKTDEACAQFYLQDRGWSLEQSLKDYFDTVEKESLQSSTRVVPANNPNMDATLPYADFGEPTTVPPPAFSFITWNLDGLDEHNLVKRTKAVCSIIFQEKPDIVFFQEVIPSTCSYFEEKLPEYEFFAGNVEGYFVITLLRRFTVYHDKHSVIPHPNSRMMRNLLVVEAHIGALKLKLINSHLESTAEHTSERISQLKSSFKSMQDTPEQYTVIFAGDLNLRDKEVAMAGDLPPGVVDLWVSCGKRKECEYTWDMVRNGNKEMPGRFKPRLRFDRAYLRDSHPKRVTPTHFGLVGIEKVPSTQCYPSDHWGIQVHFNIKSQ